MDTIRFDAIVKSLAGQTSRRRTLGALVGSALGILALTDRDEAAAARNGKCKPKCGECEKCKRGDCDKKNGKKRCQQGKCKPKSDGTLCGRGGTCLSGSCVCPPGSQSCGGGCVPSCLGATRGLNPTTCTCCGTGGDSVSCPMAGTNAACCTGTCDPVGQVCVSRGGGVACQFGAQCASGVCGLNGLCNPV